MEITPPRFDISRLRAAIRSEYTDVAQDPHCTFHFLSGRPLALQLGYSASMLDELPESAVASFAGVGNPFSLTPLEPGQVVLDIGSGAGMDALIAAGMVGSEGRVYGIDMTPAMVERASQNAAKAGVQNVRFMVGLAESLPFADSSIDVVISNGVINLCPDKPAVLREIYRVLRPGGRLQLADVTLQRPVSPYAADLVHLWTDCVAGGITQESYVRMLVDTGFRTVGIGDLFNTFDGAPVEKQANRYGARGTTLQGRKPEEAVS